MAAIKAVEAIAAKWLAVTPARAGDYESGVRNPRKDWAEETAAAEGAWKEGVAKAATAGRFGRGVKAAGTQAWQTGAITKGVPRWAQGIQLSGDKYARGFAPYREAISRVTLPPRFARRDPRNMLRVKAIVDALVDVKESILV
ncbi:MAG: hypothetical protein QGD91_12500 [Actinomycetota bacterium]|nr:hypothetical protein [Actinomycetota bacterium]